MTSSASSSHCFFQRGIASMSAASYSSGDSSGSTPRLRSSDDREELGVAAEQDVRTAARHVGRDGDRRRGGRPAR